MNGMERVVKFTTGAAAAALLAGSIGAASSETIMRRDARSSQQRNVVVLMTDDQDVASMPVMRNVLSEPFGSWVTFDNAYIANAICAPSRATLLTGQYSFNHGVIGNNWGDQLNDSNTLPVWLDNAGYETALIGKYLHSYEETTELEGWDIFLNFEDSVQTHTALAVDFIETNSDRPFFLWLAYHAPHYPAEPPVEYENLDVYVPPNSPNYNEADVSDKSSWLQALKLLPPETLAEWSAERLNAQRETLALDDSFQAIMDALASVDELDDTLVIFMSDNGYSWGSHRLIKKQCAFEECSRVPLRIRYPGLVGNRTESRAISNVDLAATIADFAGVAPGLPQDGRSLIPLLVDEQAPWEEAVLLERPRGKLEYYGLVANRWKYIDYVNQGEVELYDLRDDPFELENLSRRSSYAAKLDEMADRLSALLRGERPPELPTITPASSATATLTPDGTVTATTTATATITPSPDVTPTAPPTMQVTPTPTMTVTPTAAATSTPAGTITPLLQAVYLPAVLDTEWP